MAKNLLSRVTVRPEAPSARHVERPTDATLDKFEQASGLALPATYREFATTFGAGELAGFYRMYAPLPKRYRFGGQIVYDLAAENERLRPHLGEYECPGGPADYWVFCTDGGGVMYAWNVNEPARGEYRIYELVHRDEVRLAAETFPEFVSHCCHLDYWRDDDKPATCWEFARFRVPPRS
ncbi:SMI1/KNR4 family protein [bacterium]|nr:SMI1/KNR4 family protein [bacterium]